TQRLLAFGGGQRCSQGKTDGRTDSDIRSVEQRDRKRRVCWIYKDTGETILHSLLAQIQDLLLCGCRCEKGMIDDRRHRTPFQLRPSGEFTCLSEFAD